MCVFVCRRLILFQIISVFVENDVEDYLSVMFADNIERRNHYEEMIATDLQ